jgi:hypothetical protein
MPATSLYASPRICHAFAPPAWQAASPPYFRNQYTRIWAGWQIVLRVNLKEQILLCGTLTLHADCCRLAKELASAVSQNRRAHWHVCHTCFCNSHSVRRFVGTGSTI